MSSDATLSAERVRSAFDYDPDTGVFRWKNSKSNKVKDGQIAGCVNAIGYVFLSLDGRRYLGHRIAWLYMNGEVPRHCIDHINGDRADNRFCNLREATRSQNSCNRGAGKRNQSGLKGVSRATRTGRWVASIMIRGQRRHLGTFGTPDEAHAAYCQAANEIHGEFAHARRAS